MKRINLNFLKFLLGIIIILIFLKNVGIKSLLSAFYGIEYSFLFLAMILYISGFFTGAFNLYLLVGGRHSLSRYSRLLRAYLISWATGMFLPGKIGELSIVYFLKKEGNTLGKSLVICIMDKAITVISLLSFAVFGFFAFLSSSNAIKLILIILCGFSFFSIGIMSKWGRNLIKKVLLKKYAKKFKGFSKDLFYYLKHKRKLLIINYVITLIKWAFIFWMVYLLFMAMGFRVSFLNILLVVSTVTVISLVPLTISGLGIREVSAAYFFGKLSTPVPLNITLGVYLIILIINYMVAFISLITLKNKDFILESK